MPDVPLSTIAQAVYANPQDCNFVRVVTEVEALLTRLRKEALRTRWDYDDVVVFDIGTTRIALAWSEDRTDDVPACLLVSVGPCPASMHLPADPTHETLCTRLVERIQLRYPPDAVLWRQLPLAIEAELVAALIDSLPPIGDLLGVVQPPRQTAAARGQTLAKAGIWPPVNPLKPANDRPDLPGPAETELARVRAALYPPAEQAAPETAQMRLAAQAMNATLIVVWMPLGVAAMTYSLMKGENIGFSARVMAVTGALLGLSQTPFVQQVAALAGA